MENFKIVSDLLSKLNLTCHFTKFKDEEYDDDCLLGASDSDLKELGLSLGERKKLLASIKNFIAKKVIEEQLADFYNHNDFINFHRIDRTPLSLDTCYVNLTVVPMNVYNPKEKTEYKAFESDFIRPRSSEELIYDENEKCIIIELKNLFENKKNVNWENVDFKRILIFGRAGVGKTTLCKKIVYDYYKKNVWKNNFHRVIWIALRDLKQIAKPESKSHAELSDVYTRRFFNRKEDGIAFSDAITQEERNGEKILFILDGWDEIEELLADGHWMKNVLLDQLLKKPFLIVTSRPYTMGLKLSQFDEVLETVGFTRENVFNFIKKIIPGSDIQNKVLKFVNSHSTISGMASMPIQLDMLCYLCSNIEDLEKCLNTETATMTKLYDVLVKKMMDLNQIRKLGSLTFEWINDTYKNIFSNFKRGKCCQSISQFIFLAEVAYNAFLANQIEFSDKFFPSASLYSLEIRNQVKESYFLNCLNPSESAPEKKSYTFMHLTFQEFMAALHIVHILEKDERTQLISKYKYNPRFKIIWSFVAGLFDDPNELDLYFNYLERSPIEITGIPHQLLMVSCINECESILKPKRMDRLLEELWNWLPGSTTPVLAIGIELPQMLYERMLTAVIGLDEKAMRISEICLKSKWLPDSIVLKLIDIIHTIGFSPDSFELVTEKLQDILSSKKGFIGLNIIERIEIILNDLLDLLNEANSSSYQEALNTSSILINLLVDCELKDDLCQTLLNIFEAVAKATEKIDSKTRNAVLMTISSVIGNSRSDYKNQLLHKLTELLSMKNNRQIQTSAILCLGNIKFLTSEMQIFLAENFESFSLGATRILQRQLLDGCSIEKIVSHLRNGPSYEGKRYCLHVLSSQHNLSENIQKQILDEFETTDDLDLKQAILHLFMGQFNISDEIADKLMAHWESDDVLLYLYGDIHWENYSTIPVQILNEFGRIFVDCDEEDNDEYHECIIRILIYLKGKQIPEIMRASLFSRLKRKPLNSESIQELKSILDCLLFHCVFCHLPEFPCVLIDLAVDYDILARPISNVFKQHQHLFTDSTITKLYKLALNSTNDDKLINVFQILSNYKKVATEVLFKAMCFLRSVKLPMIINRQFSVRSTLCTLLKNQEHFTRSVLLHILDITNWYSDDYYAKHVNKVISFVPLAEIVENLTESNWKNVFDHVIWHKIKLGNIPVPVFQIMEHENKLAMLNPAQNDPQEIKYLEPSYLIDEIRKLSNRPIRPDTLTIFFKFRSKQESLLHIQKLPKVFSIQRMDLLVYTNPLCKYIKFYIYKEKPSDEDFDLLLQEITRRLENYDFLHLDLRDNHLKDENIHRLKECLRNCQKKISTLILSNNHITCGKDGLRSLLDKSFCTKIGLKNLYLDRNNIYLTQEDFNSTLRKTDSLLAESGLEILDLSGNFIPEGKLGRFSDNILAPRHILLSSGLSIEELEINVRFIKNSSVLNSCEVTDDSFSFTPIHNQFYYLKPDLESPRRISKSVGCIILAYAKSSFLSKHAFFGIDWVPPDQCDNFGQRQLIKSELVINRDDKSLIRIKILQIPPTKFVEDFSAENVKIRGVIFAATEKISKFLDAIYRSRDTANIYEYKLLASSSSSYRGQFNCITWADIMLQQIGITLDTMKTSYRLS